jgi:hypothetical protein
MSIIEQILAGIDPQMLSGITGGGAPPYIPPPMPAVAGMAAQPPQQQAPMQQPAQPPMGGLMGNPLLGAGMGMLAAGYDSRVNPWTSAMQGMTSMQMMRNRSDLAQAQKDKLKREQMLLDNNRKSLLGLRDSIEKRAKDPDSPGGVQHTPREQMELDYVDSLLMSGGSAPDAYKDLGLLSSDGGLPSKVQEYEYYSNLNPDQRELYRDAVAPAAAAKYGIGARHERAAQDAKMEFSKTFRETRGPARTATQKLQETLDKAKVVATNVMAGITQYTDADIQELQGMIAAAGLDVLASLPVPLTPLSDPDIRMVQSTIGSITNRPEANVALLERAVKAAKRIEADLDAANAWMRDSNNDPIDDVDKLYEAQLLNRYRLGLDVPDDLPE